MTKASSIVAADLLDEAELLAAEVGSPPWVDGRIDQYRGVIAVHRGDFEDARSIARAALARTTSPAGRSRLLNLLCIAACEESGYDEAREAALGSLEIATGLGNTESRAVDLGNLAEIELLAGNPHAAARRQLECLAIALELGSLREVISSWVIAARLAAMSGDWETATRLQSASDATMERIGLSLYPMDRAVCDELLAEAPTHTGSSQFDTQREIGRTLTVTDATDEAGASSRRSPAPARSRCLTPPRVVSQHMVRSGGWETVLVRVSPDADEHEEPAASGNRGFVSVCSANSICVWVTNDSHRSSRRGLGHCWLISSSTVTCRSLGSGWRSCCGRTRPRARPEPTCATCFTRCAGRVPRSNASWR